MGAEGGKIVFLQLLGEGPTSQLFVGWLVLVKTIDPKPPADGEINTPLQIHTGEFHNGLLFTYKHGMKYGYVLQHGMSLGNTMLCERSQTRKAKDRVWCPVARKNSDSGIGKSIQMERRSLIARSWEGGGRMAVAASGHRVSFWGDKMP